VKRKQTRGGDVRLLIYSPRSRCQAHKALLSSYCSSVLDLHDRTEKKERRGAARAIMQPQAIAHPEFGQKQASAMNRAPKCTGFVDSKSLLGDFY
jgi:hypothetical protein